MPRSPPAKSPGGALKSTCCRPWSASALASRRRRQFVGEEELDGLEAVARGRREAVEEGVLRVHHRQVGGKARHRVPPLVFTSARRSGGAARRSASGDSGAGLGSRIEPQARRLLELLEHRHRRRGRLVPDVRAEPRQHDGADRHAEPLAVLDRRGDTIGDERIAGARGKRAAARGRPSSRSTA